MWFYMSIVASFSKHYHHSYAGGGIGSREKCRCIHMKEYLLHELAFGYFIWGEYISVLSYVEKHNKGFSLPSFDIFHF